MSPLTRIKSVIPTPLLTAYHWALTWIAAARYRFPSNELIVIGVTGTNGKTTTSYFIAKALEGLGVKTGCTTTALLKVADREWLNSTKNTMRGRFFLQRMLREMVDAGCAYAVIETSSQGLVQYRHVGIKYDVAVFTNLTPEHIEAHGGFENYKRAKKLLFTHVANRPEKKIQGKHIPISFVANAESEHAHFYVETVPPPEQVYWYSTQMGSEGFVAEDIRLYADGSDFRLNGQAVHVGLPGQFNVENALAALATVEALALPLAPAIAALGRVTRVPGRVERVEAGQSWKVLVDYAPDPESLRRLYEMLTLIPHRRLIHVLGSCGGGRDIARQPILGQMAGRKADIVVVTNEDPYDDDPWEIIHRVAAGAAEVGKEAGKSLYQILDRREAIQTAMQLAGPEDLVLMTGKACEPWMCVSNDQKIPWDEVGTAREAILLALAKQKGSQA